MRVLTVAIFIAITVCGCSSPKPAFDPVDSPITWPAPPALARIAYVGQVSTNDDLKPAGMCLRTLVKPCSERKMGTDCSARLPYA
ncbi:MAG: hypothetical protein ABSH20_22365, partial [Tepidisphaeraceae bacterium]